MIRRPRRSTLFPYTTLSRPGTATGATGDQVVDGPLFRHVGGVLQGGMVPLLQPLEALGALGGRDRKSTRLNSSHANISYAVFCLKKHKNTRLRMSAYDVLSD